MKLYYDNILLGEIITNQSFTVDEALNFLKIDMNKFTKKQGWEDWDWEQLRTEN